MVAPTEGMDQQLRRRRIRNRPLRLRRRRVRVINLRQVLGSVDGGRKRALALSRLTWEKKPPSTTIRNSRNGSTRRMEQRYRNLHRLPHLSGRRPHHQGRWKSLPRPQETSLPLLRGQLLLLTFRHRRVRLPRGSGRTWHQTIHSPYHQPQQVMRQDSSNHLSLRPVRAPKRRRKTSVVDTSTSSNNQIRHHLHRRRRSLHFHLHWIFIQSFLFLTFPQVSFGLCASISHSLSLIGIEPGFFDPHHAYNINGFENFLYTTRKTV